MTGSQESGDRDSSLPPEVQTIIQACISNAGDLLSAAHKVREAGLPHIAYHLAALALEEIGKSELVGMIHLASDQEDRSGWLERYAGDHVKKLFWAVWGPSFGRELITKDQIENNQGLARSIHETRLRGLYVTLDLDNFCLPKEAVSEAEVDTFIPLVTARLGMARSVKLKSFNPEEKRDISWFMAINGDPEKRRLIFGQKSMEKLVELGHPASWIRWLREQFEQAEAEGRAEAERELMRQEPSEEEADNPKWQIRVRLVTNSHSIRPRTLNYWNSISNWIKLYPVDKKKDQLLVEFILPRRVPVQGVWWAGWGASRRFVTALNIGSMGYFWWYVPEQISRYYEKLKDLEKDDELIIERSPVLKLDWGREALSEQDLRNVVLCFGMLPGSKEPDRHEPFNHYLTGLGFLSKNDIHLQFEFNAYEQFYLSLKTGMRQYGDWDGVSPFTVAFDAVMADVMPDTEERHKYLRLGEQFLATPPVPKDITLSEVGAIKLLCDAYYLQTFRRIAHERSKEKGENA